MSFNALRVHGERFGSALRARCLAWCGVKVGRGCRVAAGARLARTWYGQGEGELVIGDDCDIRHHAVIESWGGMVRLGARVFVGPHVVIYGHGGVEVGDQSLLSMHVCIVSSNHAVPEIGTSIRSQPDELRPTRIGRDVWIGARSVVLGGVTIGDGCVIGAGSVVTKSLPAGAIAFGSPATIRGWRPGAAPAR